MATFLLEVGTEELPASFVASAMQQWRSRISASLKEQFLDPSAIHIYGTPRRLALVLEGLPERQPDREEEVKGPSVQAAFKDGKPTKAAEGFARSRGVSVEDFETRATDKGEFIFVTLKIPGRSVKELLMELVPQWIFGLEGKRFMRWGDGDQRFSRPVRWLVTLWDEEVLPLTLENGAEVVTSDRLSQGHRVLSPEPVIISQASDYLATLRKAFVEPDPAQRRQTIQAQAEEAARTVGGVASINTGLLDEVTDLVEYPTAVVGKFEPEFLEVPAEVLVMEMESHQRYFPVLKAEGSHELLPCFITISNGDPAKSTIIAEGNGRVIRARLSDGRYFFDADRKKALEDYLPQLETVTFQEDLGSVRQKVERIVQIAGHIARQLNLSEGDRATVERAALLCKADLVTQMVGEFPELQGVMGQKYAIASNESPAVADAIFEHYLPRGANDQMPKTLAGQVTGVSDRLDTLVGIFSLGMIPTGSSDPFALRRAANAIVSITWDANLAINLEQLLDQVIADFVAADLVGSTKVTALRDQLRDFFLQRVRTLLEEQGVDYDLVNAVLGDDPAYTERALQDLLDVRDRALFLQSIRANGTLNAIYETVNRSTRLAKQGDLDFDALDPAPLVTASLFEKPSEQGFYDSLVQLLPQTQAAKAERNYQKLVDALVAIAPTVSNFFDGETSVLVMADDDKVRRNRLNLLGLLRNHARVLADFGAIVKG
ncbi:MULTISPECIES: glycine--tRNA ligase subunit beta [unclassified Leptolyngbya]|uniref:glycine--tRNA ligase subunit beta n=1 Tax=unclassified Leptolyngbya TaxID=2650499 RepID=UPI001684A86E|nr:MULTISPECIES: glycine--tRNA ligase subunit beta [unclassified Leptolyngbya]MBD1912223.1 glycine--tRNA ligase subunit beta [Leptolyngbya sp. FACHB-8]MBD2155114.1 glycine--tRNA ligase subunit beta [Leptolyngbya sp. FACHB-16]